jgi:uncharacterized repeat protein (TIGR03806 family)
VQFGLISTARGCGPCFILALAISFLWFHPTLLAQNYGLDAREPVGAFLDNRLPPVEAIASGDWKVEIAFPNLIFEDPVFLLPEPGTNRLFVCGRQGYIWAFPNIPNTPNRVLVLNLSAQTQGWEACGLLGMAFHPEWRRPGSPNRGYFYVWYQYSNDPWPGPDLPPADTPGFTRLSRFRVPDGSDTADPISELVMVHQYDRHVWHEGGGMFFGDDGFLYISNGDEGGLRDQYDSAQRLNRGLFSGVLRIDVDQNPARSHPIRRQPRSGGTGSPPSYSANYFIPNDNPFLDPAGTILEEFWAIGLRSPHRMTLDRLTQTIWLGDVGQDRFEEVSTIVRRGNGQWPYREGFQTGPRSRPVVLLGVEQPPVYDYPHESGNNCVIGGYVYRGTRFPELSGKYLFGDNGSGRIWMMDSAVSPVVVTQLCTLPGSSWTGLSSFGLDHDNEIYLCKMGSAGRIYRLTRETLTQSPMPALLSQAGAFTDLNTLAPARGLIPFHVNSPLWSDGADKRRWIALPNDGSPYGVNETVAFSATGEWEFPTGTVFVKHFELSTNEANPSLKRRLETRFLVLDTNGAIYGATYKWRADNSDADLLTDSLSEDVTIGTASGTRVQTWYYPSPHDCRVCHNANAKFVLGVKTRQLNGNFTYPASGRTDNQLRTWNHLGMFLPALNESDIGTFAQLVSLTNAGASLESRVRSYLDANCSQCHRPGGVVQGYFDARFDTPLASQGLLDGRLADTLGISGARVIAPLDVAHSMLHTRMNSTEPTIKMPPLARNLVDSQAVQLLEQWIQLLPPTANTLPLPWQHQDIGDVSLPGNAIFSEGAFTISGSGWDIWSVTDAFHYVYQTISANGEIIARVTGVPDTNPWAKAGLMFRQNLTENSPHALLFLTPDHGVGLQSRVHAGDESLYIGGPFLSAPLWLKLVRTGSSFDGYSSLDGAAWSPAGSVTVPLTGTFYFGLAVTSHTNSIISSGTFDNVRVTSGLPDSWEGTDIGSVDLTGGGSYLNGTFAITGSGQDIFGTADSFFLAYQRVVGDGEIVAQVLGLADSDGWAKAGVMWRDSLGESSANVLLFLTPIYGIGFQHRLTTGGETEYLGGPGVAAPYWLKLVKSGNSFQASSSPDGIVWSLVATQAVAMSGTNYVGLAVTSHNIAIRNTANFDSVRIGPPVGPQPRLTLLRRDPDGAVHLQVEGQVNSSYSLEVSTRLSDWTAVATQTAVTSTFVFTNRSGTNLQQFYRVRAAN